jgi:hypothetical protein
MPLSAKREMNAEGHTPGLSVSSRTSLCAAMAIALILLAGCTPNVQWMQDRGDVPGLVDALGFKDDAQTRSGAATALARIGAAEAVVPLLKAQSDPDATVQVAANTALPDLLHTLGPAVVVVPLLKAQSHPDATVRAAAQSALAEHAYQFPLAEVVVPLLKAQSDPDTTVRAAAKGALLQLLDPRDGVGPEDAVTALTVALRDERKQLRVAADAGVRQYATNLGGVFAIDAMALLLDVQADQDADVRAAATKALTAMLNRIHGQEDIARPTAEVDKHVVAELIGDLGDLRTTVHNAAGAELRMYLCRIDTDRAAAAVAAAKVGDAWRAAPAGPGREQLVSGGRQRDEGSSIYRAIHVARGELMPIAGAGSYEPSVGFHPALTLVLAGSAVDRDADPFLGAPDRWEPTALRFLELVVIVDNVTQEELGVCSGRVDSKGAPTPDIMRYQLLRTVRVVFARTGKLFEKRTFKGSSLGVSCTPEEPYRPVDIGMAPDLTQAIPWLESLIHPPGT